MSVSSSSRTSTSIISVGGVTPLTSTDYPGQLAAVLFCQGCPLRCLYCHNPHLLPRSSSSLVPWDEIITFLKKRIGLLDAVVFSGGEPCRQSNLAEAILQVKELGFKIGLHSSGLYPKRLQEILPYLDWVGLDIKQTFEKYSYITHKQINPENIASSLQLLINSGIDFECRTTVHSELMSVSELNQIAVYLKKAGVKKFAVQAFNKVPVDSHNLNESNNTGILSPSNLAGVKAIFPDLEVRGSLLH